MRDAPARIRALVQRLRRQRPQTTPTAVPRPHALNCRLKRETLVALSLLIRLFVSSAVNSMLFFLLGLV